MERSGGYRGLDEMLRRRRSMLEQRGAFLEHELAPVFHRRKRSALFGKSLTLFGVAALVLPGLGALVGTKEANMTTLATLPLVLAFPVSFALSRFIAFVRRNHASPALPPLPKLEGEDERSMVELDQTEAALDAYPRRHEDGVGWLLVGLGWVLPLTIHYVVALVLGGTSGTKGFGAWAAISALGSLQSHITLAFQSRRFARLLSDDAEMNVHFQWFRALGLTTLVASIPWVVFFAIPSIITALTGILFVPFMYVLAKERVRREHEHVQMLLGIARNEAASLDTPSPSLVSAPVRIELSGPDGAFSTAGAEEEDADRSGENDRAARQPSA